MYHFLLMFWDENFIRYILYVCETISLLKLMFEIFSIEKKKRNMKQCIILCIY